MRPSRSPWIPRLIVVSLGVALALATTEIGLRVFRSRSPRLNALLYSPTVRTHFDEIQTTPDLLATSTLGYQPLGHTPGFVLNSRGFRTDEYTEAKPPGVFRVIVLGDSFTFDSYGVPIEQMWHQVLEHVLAERTGHPVEVLSLSAPAVGPRFELRLWELEGRRLDPDLVILAFFIGNDFTDEAGTPLEHTLDGALARHSLCFRLVRNLVRLRPWRDSPRRESPAQVSEPGSRGGFELPSYASSYDPEVPTFDEKTFERIERDRLLVYAGPDEDRFDRLFGDTTAVIVRLSRDVEATGASFVVMLIPDQAQTEPSLADRLSAALPLPASSLDIERPQKRLGAYFTAQRIPHLDLLEQFRDAGGERRLYKLRDTHWSAAGNRFAGTALGEYLLERGFGPADRP